MGRNRSPNRDKSFEIFREHNGCISSKEIAEMLNEKLNNINTGKEKDKWRKKLKNTPGAPLGNQNALGNKGGAPKGNYNSLKTGEYTKRIPFAVKTIMEELNIEDPIEKLWRSICLQEARIIHMQDIMHVNDKNDMTKELKKITDGDKMSGEEWEIQFAWDKEANLINTQTKAMGILAKLIKQYDEMLHANWDSATEEQKLRVERVKAHIEEYKIKKEQTEKRIELEREKFEHQKSIDAKKYW